MRTVSARDDGDGGAIITVSGAASLTDTRFRIVRGDDTCLQANGKWAGNKADLTAQASRSGNDLVLQLDSMLCENTEETTYYFELAGYPGEQMSVSWPAIAQAVVQRSSSIKARTIPKPTPPPAAAPPQPTVLGEPIKPIATPVTPILGDTGSPIGVKIGIGGAVLVAALAVALFVLKPWATPPATPTPVVTAPAPPTPEPTPAPTPAPVPTPAVAPADADSMSVAELARGTPPVMLAQAIKRMPTKPQDALLLLEVAGSDQHYGPALAALGKVYDPLLPRQGGIPADARQAAKAYHDASRHQDDSAGPEREALHQRLLQQRDGGDTQSKLILGDFWP